MKSSQPPREFFDEELANRLLGRGLLIGITHNDKEGRMVSRSQVFGRAITADRQRGFCIQNEESGEETWFPPDTRGIRPAPPGEYRNRATGEVVNDPDYLGSWTITAP
jgi:hypothetical protein